MVYGAKGFLPRGSAADWALANGHNFWNEFARRRIRGMILSGGSTASHVQANRLTTAGSGPGSFRGPVCHAGCRALAWALLRRTALPGLPHRARRPADARRAHRNTIAHH